RRIAGVIRLDLTRLAGQARGRAPGDPLRITATVVAGDIDVIVPRGLPVHVTGRIGAGSMSLLNAFADGVDVHRAAGQSPARSQIDLDLSVSFGHIIVFRSSS